MKTKHNTFTVYRDKRKEWRWRLTASNGRILADSGEGYKRKRDCLRAVLQAFEDLTNLVTELVSTDSRPEEKP